MEAHTLQPEKHQSVRGADLIGKVNRGNIHHDKEYLIKLYDFCRPDKFSKDQIRTVHMIHEAFARLTTASISAQLRTNASMHVASVDQMTYEEFVRSIPNPTTLVIINMDPLKGSGVLEIDPSITFTIIDLIFGGSGKSSGITREHTDIELSAMEGIFVRILRNLGEVWFNVLDLQPKLSGIETNPHFAMIVPPNDMIILINLKIKIGEVEGWINLCLPYITIESIIPKLSAEYWFSSLKKGTEPASTIIVDLKFNAEIFIKPDTLSIKEYANLKNGDLICLPDFENRTASLSTDNDIQTSLEFTIEKNGNWNFKVTESAPGTEDIEEILNHQTSVEKTASQTMDVLNKSFERLTDYIKGQVYGLEKKIEQISIKQEEFTSQIGLSLASGEGIISEIAGKSKPFDSLSTVDPGRIFEFIGAEHPQTIAMIVLFLEPQKASYILKLFPSELQADIAGRIVTIGGISPDVMRTVEGVLERKLSTLREDKFTGTGGINAVVDILGLVDRSTEKNIMEILVKKDPTLAGEIKKNMFVFEDIILISHKDAEKILKQASKRDIQLAIKAVPENVKEFIIENLPEEYREGFVEEFDGMGRVRLNEVEAAQQRIVNIIREMEENGEIIIVRSDEKLV